MTRLGAPSASRRNPDVSASLCIYLSCRFSTSLSNSVQKSAYALSTLVYGCVGHEKKY